MLTYLTSCILGLIQGIAEFLPISSSGHLSIFQNLMGLLEGAGENLLFEVLLHLGTFIAVCVVYWRDIIEMCKDLAAIVMRLFSRGEKTRLVPSPNHRMVPLLIVATLPMVLIIPLQKHITALYGNTLFVGFALLITGCILFFSDRIVKGKKTSRTATISDALVVGFGQCFAVMPGISRSGTTISLGMMRGFDRRFAVRFSFLMSLPAVLGSTIFEVSDAVAQGFDVKMIPIYLVGIAVAAVSGFFAIKLVNMLAQKGKFGKFAYYCWAVGLIVVIASIIIMK